MQAAIIKAGAIPALIQLLEIAQPDGQYAAAAALYNLAGQDAQVRLSMAACKAVPPLVLMLQADSWSHLCPSALLQSLCHSASLCSPHLLPSRTQQAESVSQYTVFDITSVRQGAGPQLGHLLGLCRTACLFLPSLHTAWYAGFAWLTCTALQPDCQLCMTQKCDPVTEMSVGQCKHLLHSWRQ